MQIFSRACSRVAGHLRIIARGVTNGWPKPPQSLLRKIIRQKQLTVFTTFHIAHYALRASMEEKRLECLMMLQIHRSDTPIIDAIDRFAATATQRLNFLI